MKIVHIVRQFYPSLGGLEDVVQSLAREQRRAGHDARVVTLDRIFGSKTVLPAHDEVDGIPVQRLPWRGPSKYPLCPSVIRHLGGADVVHVHAIDFFFDYMALMRPFIKGKLVASTHGGFFHTPYAARLKRVWFQTITRVSAMAYDAILCTSENDGASFSRIVSGSRLKTIENGVNLAKFQNAAALKPKKTAIYFGRLSSNKGIDRAIALLAELVKLDPEWRLIVCGRPYDVTAEQLAHIAANLGVSSAVMIEAEPSVERIRELIGQASFYFGFSRHEGFGLAAVEAMSAGLVPVLSDIEPFLRLQQRCPIVNCLPSLSCEQVAPRITEIYTSCVASDFSSLRKNVIEAADLYEWKSVSDAYIAAYRGAR